MWTVGFAVSGMLLGAAGAWLMLASYPCHAGPNLAEAWAPFLKKSNVILCAATPLHLTFGPAGHQGPAVPVWPAPAEVYPVFRNHRPLDPGAKLGMVITDNVIGVGTMNAVVAAANVLRAAGSSYQILPERVAQSSSLRTRDVILFCAPVDSEAITKVVEHTTLTVSYEPTVREFAIHDRQSGLCPPSQEG